MTSITASTTDRSRRPGRPGTAVTVIGVLMALCCVGFAVVNLVFEITDRFADGRYAEYAAAFTAMNWLVVALKVIGAGVALLSIAGRPRLVSHAVLTVLLWGAFATLALYAAGSVAEVIGILLGLTGTGDEIDLAGIGYVSFFILVATGYGVLTVSHARRHGVRKSLAVLGVLGAPVVLILMLVVIPKLLAALGLMPPL